MSAPSLQIDMTNVAIVQCDALACLLMPCERPVASCDSLRSCQAGPCCAVRRDAAWLWEKSSSWLEQSKNQNWQVWHNNPVWRCFPTLVDPVLAASLAYTAHPSCIVMCLQDIGLATALLH